MCNSGTQKTFRSRCMRSQAPKTMELEEEGRGRGRAWEGRTYVSRNPRKMDRINNGQTAEL